MTDLSFRVLIDAGMKPSVLLQSKTSVGEVMSSPAITLSPEKTVTGIYILHDSTPNSQDQNLIYLFLCRCCSLDAEDEDP